MTDYPLPHFPAHPDCTLCPLHEAAHTPGIATTYLQQSLFPDREPVPPAVVFIGMNPGVQEDKEGAPFVGPSGDILRQYIDGLSLLTRTTIYLTNTVRCGPHNKFPKSCIKACLPYTLADLSKIFSRHRRTALICTGAIATEAISTAYLSHKMKLGTHHTLPPPSDNIFLLSCYHPAYFMRSPTPQLAQQIADQLEPLNRWLLDDLSSPASTISLSLHPLNLKRSGPPQ